jgi:acetyl-CoA C-acetyltransferase
VNRIKIKSSFLTRVGRRDEDLIALLLEALRGVLSGTDLSRVAALYLASYAPGELCGLSDPLRTMTQAIRSGFPDLRSDLRGIYKTGGDALFNALEAFERLPGGDPGDVVVAGVEKMTHLPPARVAGLLSQRENPHDRAYGATLPALGALVTRSYMSAHRVTEKALHQVAVKNHGHGSKNPKAHFQRRVTLEEVASSPLVCDPLRRLHCAPTSDGAAAVLLSRAEGAVWYRGWGKGTDVPLFQERRDISRFAATAEAGSRALGKAGVTPDDVDIVEIHDAFTSFELINLEEMGFFPVGAAWRTLDEGGLTLNTPLAVNPSGGMKARGHPIGCTGVSASVEIHEQLTGVAGERQHRGARLGMIQSAGGVSNESYVFVIDTVS